MHVAQNILYLPMYTWTLLPPDKNIKISRTETDNKLNIVPQKLRRHKICLAKYMYRCMFEW